ncbi:TetR/AcrR family transcriptional regulator [Pseudonocardia endophytica]|uniref:TetR family transcriptional regulator n=1 Tax=Pseudonocardia endophytica TaxID=401976 RepID=A0A4R1IAY5_PSEEN|nr:TetR/AcrR family transcriptional regulator [Pseudonocardia endophytica]TCK27552.1 TetR family transcriptional regulator [Pseudonocardia endophytica]
MGRWEPNARLRLVRAAIDLYGEQGYDTTTVAQIAERAGLTKATFFRHFPDKREVLFAGQQEHSALLAEGVAGAPADASPIEMVAGGLTVLAASFTPEQHAFGHLLGVAVAGSAELRERDASKTAGLVAAVTDALVARGVPDATARVAGELGVLAFKQAFARWSDDERGDADSLARHATSALDELRTAAASLG